MEGEIYAKRVGFRRPIKMPCDVMDELLKDSRPCHTAGFLRMGYIFIYPRTNFSSSPPGLDFFANKNEKKKKVFFLSLNAGFHSGIMARIRPTLAIGSKV